MSKQVQDAYIVAATRTPVGKAPRGFFRNTRPDDLLAHVLKRVVAQAPGIDVSRIDDAIIGCAMPEAEQGMNVARIGVLLAGLPNTVAAQTINRFCSSGLQAVALAADQIRLGNADLMLAGGTESMSMVPMMGNKVAMAPSVFDNDHVAIAYGMGITAEKVAEEWKVGREDQDAFALASHQKALAAIAAGADLEPSWQNSLASLRRAAEPAIALGDERGAAVVFPSSGDLPLLCVRRPDRRRGLGTRLLAAAAARAGRPLRILNLDERAAGVAAFLEAAGATRTVRQLEMVRELP